MKSEVLKKEYNELVAQIESARMYDGRGKGIDVYVCSQCGKKFYTQYKDKGVTPFMMRCRENACCGTMKHKMTISTMNKSSIEVINWVRPTFEQLLKLDADTQQHVLQGGLVLETELK